MSSEYSYGFALNVQYGNAKSYTYDLSLDNGIAADTAVRFGASDIKKIDMKYEVDSGITRVFPLTWSLLVQNGNVIGVSYYNGNDQPLLFPFKQTSYYSRRVSSSFPILHSREAYKY